MIHFIGLMMVKCKKKNCNFAPFSMGVKLGISH